MMRMQSVWTLREATSAPVSLATLAMDSHVLMSMSVRVIPVMIMRPVLILMAATLVIVLAILKEMDSIAFVSKAELIIIITWSYRFSTPQSPNTNSM